MNGHWQLVVGVETHILGIFFQNDKWSFFLNKNEILKINFEVGEKYTVFDGYWGEKLELVLDEDRKWQKHRFVATEKFTHDHCFFCWITICEIENQNFMSDGEGQNVCMKCFKHFVKEKSLEFMNISKEHYSEDEQILDL